MLAYINGVLFEIHKQPTPDISNIEPVSEYIIWRELDYSSGSTLVESYIDYTDKANYWLMHHTEPTKFLYKASVWGVSHVVDFITNI